MAAACERARGDEGGTGVESDGQSGVPALPKNDEPRHSDRMSTDQQDLKVENALLRASLWLTARALKDYHDAPHFEIVDGDRPMLEVIVPELLRAKAAGALAKAEKMLKEEGRGRG